MTRTWFGIGVLGVLSIPSLCRAQTMPDVSPLDGYTAGQVQQGAPAGSYALSGFEKYNPGDGQLSINIPLVTVKGRGSVSVPLTVSLTTPIWDVLAIANPYGCTLSMCQGAQWTYSAVATGWVAPGEYGAGRMAFRSSGDYCMVGSGNVSEWNKVVTRGTFVAADGTETEFVDQNTNGTPEPGSLNYNRGTVFVADNGSMAKFTSSTSIDDSSSCLDGQAAYHGGTLVLRDGTKYTIASGSGAVTQIEDPNGNYTSFGTPITDSVGRTYTISYAGQGNNNAYDEITYYGAGGVPRYIKIWHSALSSVLASGESIETYGQLWSLPSGQTGASTQFDPNNLVSEIDLADGSKYLFQYHSYGDVAQITLPTTGVIQYSYNSNVAYAMTHSESFYWAITHQVLGVPAAYMYALTRQLTKRVQLLNNAPVAETDFSVSGEIDYKDPTGKWLAEKTVTITSDGTLPSSGTNYNPPQYNQVTTANYYDAGTTSGPGSLLESQSISYYQPSNCLVNCSTVQTVTTTMNGIVEKTAYTYDQYNNVSDEKDYNWGNGSPGGVIRDTQTTYNTNSAYTSINILGLPTEVKVKDGGTTTYTDTTYNYDEYTGNQYTPMYNCPNINGSYHDNTNFGGGQLRGNATTIARYTGTAWLYSYTAYDIAGNVRVLTDANKNQTSLYYTDAYSDNTNRNSYATLTSATNALNQTSKSTYDYNTGQPATSVDANNLTTTYTYSDPFERVTQVQSPNTGSTYYSYPSTTTTIVYQDQTAAGDRALRSQTIFDGFGRPIEEDTFENSTGFIFVSQSYDALGRVSGTTNPSRPSDGLSYATTYTYDGLGRQTKVTAQDFSVTTTSYAGNSAYMTDAAGHARWTWTDGLGRLVQVMEDPSGLAYVTGYAYGADNTLQEVAQGGQTRTFTYDMLARLKTATNPESGAVTYTYDNNGNVQSRVDARNVTTNYFYDALNRLHLKTYSDGTASITYNYDTYHIGSLASVSSVDSTTTYPSYDSMGNPKQSQTQIYGNSQVYTFNYTYNLTGSLTSETYPSGRLVYTCYDGANRATGLSLTQGCTANNYVTSIAYMPHGAPWVVYYGSGLTGVAGYNHRLQPSVLYGILNSDYNRTLFVETPNWGAAPNNNGNLMGESVGAATTPQPLGSLPYFNASFTYDKANRLATAGESGSGTWSRNFGYDQWGNMAVTANSGVPFNGLTPYGSGQYNTANNRLVSGLVAYDASGNTTSLSTMRMGYTAENQFWIAYDVNSGVTVEYLPDGFGNRVWKQVTGGATTYYLYDALGQLAAEYTGPTALTKEYIRMGGQLVAIPEREWDTVLDVLPDLRPFRQRAAGDGSECEHRLAARFSAVWRRDTGGLCRAVVAVWSFGQDQPAVHRTGSRDRERGAGGLFQCEEFHGSAGAV